jgi:transglutaminase-like putative cysteine protease
VKLRVVHHTTYSYGEPVTTSHHEARLTPRDSELQRTISHQLEISPAPETRRRHFDYFGNRTLHFSLSEPHRELDVIATTVVDLRALPPPPPELTPAWELVRDRLSSDRRRDMLEAYAMCFDSPHVASSAELAEYAAPSFTSGRPILQAVADLVDRIHNDFTYDARATDVSTHLHEVLRRRRGVCQDFSHLAIGCLRAHGLAARYVSGYLMTHPPPGMPRRIGADASHAWFSAFVPEHGWVDFDPTNNLIPRDEHVSIAFGRDFSDVTPIRGVILGGGHHILKVAVDVAPCS